MHIANALVALGATAVSAQQGATVKVTVGANGNLQYDPANLKAQVGTQVEFSFFPKNHTVTQSSFKDPCHPLDGGFFSDFVPTADSPSGTTFTITVKDEKPIWFYCGQGKHCQSGMVGAINAPESGNTFEAFKELASGPAGGVLNKGGDAGNGDAGNNTPAPGSEYTTMVYTSSWTSNGEAFVTTATTTVLVTVPAETSSAWTTKPCTSTWTSDGSTFTTTATTTLFTAAPAATKSESESSTPSPSNGAGALANNGALQVGALAMAAAAAMI